MKFQMNRIQWAGGWMIAIAGLLFFGTSALGESSSIQYPVKRFVTGQVMSISEPLEKGRDGKINVNEKDYHLNSKTIIVDENEQRSSLNHFAVGNWVYMVVNLYADHREVLYLAPTNEPREKRLPPRPYSDSN